MTKQTTTVYKFKHLKYGYEDCSLMDYSKNNGDEHMLLATAEVNFINVKTPAEILAAEVDALKRQETAVRAEAQARVQAIQDKIQSLLSITHQAEA